LSDLPEHFHKNLAAQGFPPSFRLHNSYEFDRVFKTNRYRVSGPEFLVLATENLVNHCRLGMVIGKKTAGPAVQRNRVKRLIRESFRTHCHPMDDTPHLDIVIVARPGVSKKNNEHLISVLSKCWATLFHKATATAYASTHAST